MHAQRPLRALAVLGTVLGGVLILALAPAGGQEAAQGETFDARCYGHHAAEGFRPFDKSPMPLLEVPAGEPFEFRIEIVNPWLHDILEPAASVNLSRTAGIVFPGEKKPFHVDETDSVTLTAQPGSQGTPYGGSFAVEPNATELVVSLDGDEGPLGVNDLDLFVTSPSGVVFNATPDTSQGALEEGVSAADEEVRVSAELLSAETPGEWAVEVRYPQGTSPSAAFALTEDVYYNASRVPELFVKGPAIVKPGEKATFLIPLDVANATGPVTMVYKVKGLTHYQHTDKSADDWGNFTQWDTLSFEVGDELLLGTARVPLATVDPNERIFRIWGQVTGFVGFFLLLPSLVLGGAFGLGTVRGINALVGSARRRVLWHNAVSFVVLSMVLGHTVLFLIEHFYPWSWGVLWGGTSLLAMVGLALTGSLQNQLVKRWGYRTWRFTHLLLGVLAALLAFLHIAIDGEDFVSLRDALAGV